jgi:signal transduction histidine kinase
VRDTGLGIEQNKLSAIFEPFQQVDTSVHRSFSGLGLGLTVARRMADLIGGTIEMNSQPGVGTRVLMRFPSTDAAAVGERNYG